MTQTDSQEYAQAMLRLDPHKSARQIVELRARRLGFEKQASTKAGPDVQLPRLRQFAESELAKIRSDFWITPLPQIQSRLAALKLEGMPDLAASATRLAQAGEVRPEFEQLYTERKINQQFLDALRQILVLPPAAAGQTRDQQEREVSRWRARRSVKHTARFIIRTYPRIYQLEREWLDHIASTRAVRHIARPVKPNSQSWLILFWIVMLLLSMLSRLFRS